MAQEGTAKAKKVKKEHVTPSAETNRRILKECSTTKVDVKKVEALFNCRRNNAHILAAAAELGLLPQGGAKQQQ